MGPPRRRLPGRWIGTRSGLAGAAVAFVLAAAVVEVADPFPDLRVALRRTPEDAPSSRLVSPDVVSDGRPLLSIAIDQGDLYDPARGLLANVMERGREWERPASVSYYEGGRLRFAGQVGLRIHGGLTRTISDRKSFRIYFRRAYGLRQLPRGVLFDGHVDPIRQLVIHNAVRKEQDGRPWYFVNPLAYDITRRVGAPAPYTQPVRLLLNGQFQGAYVLTERVREIMTPDLLTPRFGHARFTRDHRSRDELSDWLDELDPIRMDTVTDRIDLENLTRWFIAVLFCATEDAFQGAQLLDDTDPEARWFYLAWDMDHSFMNYNRQTPRAWQHDTFRTTMERLGEQRRGRWPSEVRSRVLTTLLAEDPDYRAHFIRVFDEVMNHRLSPDFLRERFEHYDQLGRAIGLGEADRAYLADLETFLARRPAALRRQAEVYLNTDPAVRLQVSGLGDGRGTVDGYAVPDDFDGVYFPGTTIALRAASATAWRHWIVDGEVVASPTLDLTLTDDVQVIAVSR